MATQIEGANRTFRAGAAIPQFARVKLSSEKLAACDATDQEIGFLVEEAFADLDPRAVRLSHSEGTFKAIAAGAISVGAVVYGAADGEVNDVPNGYPLGIALEAASGDQSIIEILLQSGIDAAAEALSTDTAASVAGLSTLNGTASNDVTLADAVKVGTRKMFRCITSVANPPTVTVATHELGASVAYTFEAIGDSLSLEWDGLQWLTVGGNAQLVEALTTDTAAKTYGLTTLNGAASNDVTLADGATEGLRKTFRCVTSVANPPTVTVATHTMGTSRAVYTFKAVGDTLVLEWDGLQWVQTGGNLGPVETATGTFTASPEGTTDINSSAGAVTVTLGDGDYPGQLKTFSCFVNADNSSTVSVTLHATSDPEVYTVNALDESFQVWWTGTEWEEVGTKTATV